MEQTAISCVKCVDGIKSMIKNGKTKSGKQRYICKTCGRTQVEYYTYHAYKQNINEDIVTLSKEGMGIRSTARFLKISATTLLKRIIHIAQSIAPPPVPLGKTYEVDEMQTFVKTKTKRIWIVYALDRETKYLSALSIAR